MRILLTYAFLFVSLIASAQFDSIYNPSTIGQTTRNQRVGRGFQIGSPARLNTDTTVVFNKLRIASGSPAAGKVLTSDATGFATWQPAGITAKGTPNTVLYYGSDSSATSSQRLYYQNGNKFTVNPLGTTIDSANYVFFGVNDSLAGVLDYPGVYTVVKRGSNYIIVGYDEERAEIVLGTPYGLRKLLIDSNNAALSLETQDGDTVYQLGAYKFNTENTELSIYDKPNDQDAAALQLNLNDGLRYNWHPTVNEFREYVFPRDTGIIGQVIKVTSGNGSGSVQLGFENMFSKGINTTAGDAATINATSGRFRKDTSGDTFTLTNSNINTNSVIMLTQANAAPDITAITWGQAKGAGSVVITFNAAPTSNFDMEFLVIN